MKFFKNLFKRRYPYAPIAFLGRKNTEKALGADITKLKKVEKEQEKNKATQAEHENAGNETDNK